MTHPLPPSPGGDDDNARKTPPSASPSPQKDAWSLRIATISRIPLRLHFTFLLLVIWIAVAGIGRGGANQIIFLLGIFFCVALHEFGHALVAQRYGYTVHDIVLYPIGGVATIEGTPRPRHELWIALAGPAVNLVIAGLLAGYLYLVGGNVPMISRLGPIQAGRGGLITGETVTLLLVSNIMLAVFNLIPAFPMDGGRILRAVLALKLGRPRATRIAAFIGQCVAVVLALFGLGILGGSPNFVLTLIALFVFFGAGQEAQMEQTQDVAEGAPVRDAMVREFHTLLVGDSLRRASELLLATTQQDFPVVHGDEVVGVLSRGALLRGLANEGEEAYVAGVMTRDVLFARPDDPLADFMLRPDGVQRAPVLVRDETEKLVGMLTIDNLMEFLTLRKIARDRAEEGRA